jgi:hypothetical protein
VVRDLNREINRHAERDAQDIEQREQPVPTDVSHHVPPKEAQVLPGHGRLRSQAAL